MSIEGNDYSTSQGQSPKQMADDAKQKANQAKENAKQQASQKFDEGRSRAAEELDRVAHAADAAAADLRDQDRESLSRFISEMAQGVSQFADNLRGKSADELIHQANDLARRNPAIFLAGSIAIGLGLSRFAKVAKQTGAHESYGSSTSAASRSGMQGYSGMQSSASTQTRSSTPGLDSTVPRSYPGAGDSETAASTTSGSSTSGSASSSARSNSGAGASNPSNRPRQDTDIFP